MNENKIQILLKEHNIHINIDEDVIDIVENLKSDQFKFITKTAEILLGIGIFVLFNASFILLGFIAIIIYIVSVYSQWRLLELLINKLHFFQKKGITVLTNQRVILPSKRSIAWRNVYNLKKQVNGADRFIVLDLEPFKVEYNLDGSFLDSTIEKDHFIFIGGKYDAEELIKQITPFWLDQGPIGSLESDKKALMDQFNLRVTRQQNHLSLLTGKHEDFTLNYTHVKQFPVRKLAISVEFKQPITAFLSIDKENIGTQFQQAIGFKDIQIGQSHLDRELRILGSHPEFTQQLFTTEIMDNFERFLAVGSLKIDFGAPVKQFQLKSASSSNTDTEEVLDMQLAKDNSKTSNELQHKGHSTLQLTVLINNKSGLRTKSVLPLTENLIETALHIANQLNTIRD